MKLFKLHICIATLLCSLSGSFSNAYVLSSYIWQAPDGSYKFVLGDYHEEADIGSKQSDCLKQLFVTCHQSGVPLTVVIEGKDHEDIIDNTRNTIRWLHALYKLSPKDSVIFKMVELRQGSIENAWQWLQWFSLGYMFEDFCEKPQAQELAACLNEIIKSYDDNLIKNLEKTDIYWDFFKDIKKTIKMDYKRQCITIDRLFKEIELTIEYIKRENQKIQSKAIDVLVEKIIDECGKFMCLLGGYNGDFFDYLCHIYEQDRCCSTINQLYITYVENFICTIADAGFVLELEKNVGKPSMLYCGNAHAKVINQMYADNGFTLLKKYDGPSAMDPVLLSEHCDLFLRQYSAEEVLQEDMALETART